MIKNRESAARSRARKQVTYIPIFSWFYYYICDYISGSGVAIRVVLLAW